MRLESLHKILQYFYFHGRKNKHLNKCIDALVEYTRDCLFRRLRKIARNLRPCQINNIEKSHMKAREVEINNDNASNKWSAQSATSKEL